MKIFNLKNLLGINVRAKLMVIAITIVFLVLFVSPAFCGGAQAIDTGLDAAAGQAQLPMKSDLIGVVGQIIYTILGFLGIAFVILVLYGGAIRMFAKGDSKAIEKSTGIITSAAIGVAIIMAAYIITAFVFSQVESNIGSAGGGGGGDLSNSCTAQGATCVSNCTQIPLNQISCPNGQTCCLDSSRMP